MGPTAKRQTVLNLVLGPVPRRRLKLGIPGKDGAQVFRVLSAIVFDHAGRLGDLDYLGVDLGRFEPAPRNIV